MDTKEPLTDLLTTLIACEPALGRKCVTQWRRLRSATAAPLRSWWNHGAVRAFSNFGNEQDHSGTTLALVKDDQHDNR